MIMCIYIYTYAQPHGKSRDLYISIQYFLKIHSQQLEERWIKMVDAPIYRMFFLTPWTCFEKRLGLSHQRFNLSKAPSEVWFQDHVPTNGNRVNRSIDLASNHCLWFHQSERTRFARRIVLLDKLIFLLICIHFFVIVNLVVLMVLVPMSVEQSKATWTIDETCLFSSMVSLWKITAFQSQLMSYPIYL